MEGVIIQKCKKCHTQFSWKQIYQSFWWNYKPIICNQCRTEHKITIVGRLTFVSLTIIPMLLFGNYLSPFENVFATLVSALFVLLIGSLLTPFFVTYKNA